LKCTKEENELGKLETKWKITKVGRKEEKLAEDSGYENFSLTMVEESSFYKGSSENI
jgi:hypothetical protein